MTPLLNTGRDTSPPDPVARKPRQRRTRTVVAATAGAALLLTGGGATAGAAMQAGSGGYFSTAEHRFATPTAALKTDEIEVGSSTARPDDPDPDVGELARVRIVVRPAEPRARLFVGIGPKDQVEAYLRGTAHDVFAGADLKPFHADFERRPGAAAATAPGSQTFWVATSAGSGDRVLSWNKTHGAWSLVVMRMDGSPALDVRASIGLRFGFLAPAGIGLLLIGALAIAYIPFTRRRRA
ncbi:hypothetical protein [Actinomadura sp. NTSP31]|uniref:hypothetical protein n=1 Tax=Actinomadura sp. NTSP31 TaxID=1735447 RepID=UPI0035BFA2B1